MSSFDMTGEIVAAFYSFFSFDYPQRLTDAFGFKHNLTSFFYEFPYKGLTVLASALTFP